MTALSKLNLTRVRQARRRRDGQMGEGGREDRAGDQLKRGFPLRASRGEGTEERPNGWEGIADLNG